MELKKLVLLCQHMLHMKSTTSLLRDSTIPSAKFLFFVFYRYLKEKDHVKRNINSKERNNYIGNQYYYYFGLPKIRVSWPRTTKN